jgi:hypothetical protein
MPRRTRTRRQSAGDEGNTKKNEFEIWAEFTQNVAKLFANEIQRMKGLADAMKPGRTEYSVGDFLQDQLKISTKLLEAYLKAARRA